MPLSQLVYTNRSGAPGRRANGTGRKVPMRSGAKARYVASGGIVVALTATACGSSSSSPGAGSATTGAATSAASAAAAATSAGGSAAAATSGSGAASGAKCANGKLTVWLMSDAQTGWPAAVKS